MDKMKDSNQVIDQVKHAISQSPKDSPTAAGLTEPGAEKAPPTTELIDALNQIFSLFSINFHNQYYAAFKEPELEVQAKRLWLGHKQCKNLIKQLAVQKM